MNKSLNDLFNITHIASDQKFALRYLFRQKIENYEANVTFLTEYQLKKFKEKCLENKIYENYRLNVNYENYKSSNKTPYIIFLTKKQAKDNLKALKDKKRITLIFSANHFKKVCRPTLNTNIQFLGLLDEILRTQGEDVPDSYNLPEVDYWTLSPSKDVKLYKKPSKKTATIGYKQISIKDFFNNFEIRDKIENYYPYQIFLREEDLKKYLDYIKKIEKIEKKFGQKNLIKNKKKN